MEWNLIILNSKILTLLGFAAKAGKIALHSKKEVKIMNTNKNQQNQSQNGNQQQNQSQNQNGNQTQSQNCR